MFILCSRIEGDQFGVPSIQELRQYQIVVATLSTARALALMGLPKGHFTHIFIDEAAQVDHPSPQLSPSRRSLSLPPLSFPHSALSPSLCSLSVPPLSLSLSLIYGFVFSIIGLYSGLRGYNGRGEGVHI